MHRKSLHICNMFIMKYDIFVDYCEFLFNVLFLVENRLGNKERIYGYIGERLLDVYLYKKNYKYIEVNVINTERINWPKKVLMFLRRKYEK